MSSSGLFSIGTRAMAASYAALQVTGNNIANVNTRGYSRQEVQLTAAGAQFNGNGFFGKGVDVTTVTRAHDEFLTREAALTQSVAEADSARLTQLQQLEKVFGTGESGLGYLSGQLLNAFAAVASQPQDTAAREVVLEQAGDTATRFRAAADQISGLQSAVTQDIGTSLQAVNALARTVASLNKQIAAAMATGQTPNDLLDQRDLAVADMGRYIQVTAVDAGDGTQSLFVGGGQRLVLGGEPSSLMALADPYDPSKVQIGVREGAKTRLLVESNISGGSVAGLLRFQNEDLPDARNALGQMAAAIGGALNAQQALGLDLTTAAGRPGGALFAIGAPRVLPSSANSGDAAIGLQTADASSLRASDYTLTFDGSNYALARVGGAGVLQTFTPGELAAGVTVDGMQISITSGTPVAGDSFLLQPVAAAASGMARVLDDPRGIAAASPVTATLGAANTGTLSVQALDVRSPITSPTHAVVKFSVDSVTQATTWQLSVDGGASFSAAQPLVAGQPIGQTDASGKVLWQLSVGGTPADGDTVNVDPTAYPAANNGNALAFTALRDTQLVAGSTVTDAWSNALTTVGVRVQSAASTSEMSTAVATDAQARNAAKSGVNLDEEAARLIQYQQSYQAAAKMLQVAQSVFDALLQVTTH